MCIVRPSTLTEQKIYSTPNENIFSSFKHQTVNGMKAILCHLLFND